MGDKFPIFVMPYAVNNEFFARRTAEASTRRSELQQELALDPTRPVILYASKLQERKHCDHLLEAYIQLRQQTQLSPQLLIVGDGEKRQQLEERARSSGVDGIHFAGFRNQSELPRFFDLSTMFVLPARHEPWGLIVNEAMAAGKTVIASDQVGAAADLLHPGKNGFIFPMGDIAALRDAIIETLAPGVAETMGEHSREILSTWGFPEDLIALHSALRFLTRKSIS
jgi:glycosyltransferase involved in cell wall biosynthesis